MKLRLGIALVLLLSSLSFFNASFSNARSRIKAQELDPILQSLLEFHPSWITRSVTSHDGSGGNDDGGWNGNAPVVLDGIKYQTLFHGEGEGSILRLWMTTGTNSKGVPTDYKELRIEIDGKTFYRGKPIDFFSGNGPWKYPLVMNYQETSGSFLSYLPIPYGSDAKILFLGTPQYYQVTYRQGTGSSQGPSAAQVSTFMSDRSWATQLAQAPTMAAQIGGTVITGPTTLSGLRLDCTQAELLDLRVRVGGLAPVPAAFFFGIGSTGSALPGKELAEVHSELNDITISGDSVSLLTRLPIPLQAGESISFESASGATPTLFYATESAAPLFTGTHLDMEFIDQAGPGIPTTMPFYQSAKATQFVSLVEQITGNPPGNRRYLEGDEMVRTDQMSYPLQLGTGTEDYFNGGWYFIGGPFTNPNSGEPRFNVINPGTDWSAAGFEHSLYRHHVLDPIVGRTGMRFGFETGDIGDFTPIEYQTLATAYQFDTPNALGAPISLGTDSSAPMIQSSFDAESNEPQIGLNVSPSMGQVLSMACPAGANSLLLTRTYDAVAPLQAAAVSANTHNVGMFFEAYSNPTRRFAQDAIWVQLQAGDCASNLNLSITPIKGDGQGWNETSYQVQFFQ